MDAERRAGNGIAAGRLGRPAAPWRKQPMKSAPGFQAAPWESARVRELVGLLLFCLWQVVGAIAHADAPNPAASLRAAYGELRGALGDNSFRRPIHLRSGQSVDDLTADIHAVVEHPFATVQAALKSAPRWCDVLILHLNVKSCRASASRDGLAIYLGSKHDEPLSATQRVDFRFRVAADGPDYFRIQLTADAGPFGTRNYRIVLEAIPLEGSKTFLHFSYAYAYGLAAKLAMQTYLGTVGRNKVGFTVERGSDGQAAYVGGMRGVLERNTLRYYLAIDAYLGALSTPPQEQFEKRLRDWFAATERYPRQLHELEQGQYLDMKRKEYRRQQAEP